MKLSQHIFSLKTTRLALIALLFFAALPSQETFAQTAKDSVYMTVDEMPIPPGGTDGWNAYLGKNMNYPIAARDAKVEGMVVVTFVVLKNGEISNVEILRGIGKGCDEEVMRLVKESPNWTPGKKDGEIVITRMRLPVNFKL
ncbi:protein TonB [Algoriphagus ratkowskyi]|uniref:Energy transducer TonB n=1 Tax=Algoriphagus ratkowskyi TaxID=57028 RepID=A0A2W7QTZ3_9BACT|nr:energy transducer TonB [Algoriphagus ratkowskyi]PZX50626.1 protein TonB [Algoriphagus ratkowskyi]TXD79987.1 energy transducer TonB [Algoriphagus ratkowskyi]